MNFLKKIKPKIVSILSIDPNYYLKLVPKHPYPKAMIIPHVITGSLMKILLSAEIKPSKYQNVEYIHHVGIVITVNAKIREGTKIFQNTTIGKNKYGQAPIIDENCVIYANCNIIGDTKIDKNVSVGMGGNIADSEIGENTKIESNCTIQFSKIGMNCKIRCGSVIRGINIPDNSTVEPQMPVIKSN